jgi:hypothetical protein
LLPAIIVTPVCNTRPHVGLFTQARDELTSAMDGIRRMADAMLDGTVILSDHVADQKPLYSGTQRRHWRTCKPSRTRSLI